MLAVDQQIELDQGGGLEALELVLEGGIAAGGGLQPVEEVEHHLGQRQFIARLHLAAHIVELDLHPALLDAQVDDPAQVVLGDQDVGLDDGLADLADLGRLRQVGRVVHHDDGAVVAQDLVDDRGGRGDQVEVVLALQALLDDLHVEHAEEAAAEAEAQGLGGLRLVEQGGVVQAQLAQGVAQFLVGVRVHRVEPGEDPRLDLAETRQVLLRRAVGAG